MTKLQGLRTLFLVSCFLLPEVVLAVNTEQNSKTTWETLEPYLNPTYYLADATWTTIGWAMLQEFSDNDFDYVKKTLSLDDGNVGTTIAMLQLPMKYAADRFCPFCNIGVGTARIYLEENPWIPAVALLGCASLSAIDTKTAWWCTVPVIGGTILLRHAPLKSLCDSIKYCPKNKRREASSFVQSENFNGHENEAASVLNLIKREKLGAFDALIDVGLMRWSQVAFLLFEGFQTRDAGTEPTTLELHRRFSDILQELFNE